MSNPDRPEELPPLVTLLDWKRRIQELYASIRADDDPESAWERWREQRDTLFRDHPQSPLSDGKRGSFDGLHYFEYGDEARVEAIFEPSDEEVLQVGVSTGGGQEVLRRGKLLFDLKGSARSLDLFWVAGYGGGAFVPFADETNGRSTYGGGRYLLDTIKGADLGMTGAGRLILDFNFAYNPSCSYDPRWSCPLAPPANRLALEITAGERHPA